MISNSRWTSSARWTGIVAGICLISGTILATDAVRPGPFLTDQPDVATPPAATAAERDVPVETNHDSSGARAEVTEQAAAGDEGDRAVPAVESLPLGRSAAEARGAAASSESGGLVNHWAVRTGLALAAVISLMFVIKWTFQWLSGRGGGIGSQLRAGGRSPSGVLEVLGRYPIARGQTLALLKLDRRILLVAQTASGFQTLSEITNPDEVASILLKTRDDEGESMAARFSALLKELERDPEVAQGSRESRQPIAMRPQSDEYVPSDREERLRRGRRS